MEPEMFASGMHFSIFSSQGLYNTNLFAYKAIMYIYTGFLLPYKWVAESVSYINSEIFASGMHFSIFFSQVLYNTNSLAIKLLFIYIQVFFFPISGFMRVFLIRPSRREASITGLEKKNFVCLYVCCNQSLNEQEQTCLQLK